MLASIARASAAEAVVGRAAALRATQAGVDSALSTAHARGMSSGAGGAGGRAGASSSAASSSSSSFSTSASSSASASASSSRAPSSSARAPLREQAPPMLDADARLRRRLVPDEGRRNALDADPYGWAPEDRALREAPLWMVLEAEREESRIPRASAKAKGKGESKSALILAPVLDAQGRAYATGRRKTAVARVWVTPSASSSSSSSASSWTVNGQDFVDYFPRLLHRAQAMQPFVATQAAGAFDVACVVGGGGKSGQAGALRHGLAKALAAYDPFLKPVLSQMGLLFRDPRVVERKKPGQKKARKKFQWVKR